MSESVVTDQILGLLAGWTCDTDAMADTLAERINCGECGCFADALVERLYDEDRLNAFTLAAEDFMRDVCKPRRHDPYGIHIWTYVPETGLHYDSEVPEGVSDWRALPFFARWGKRHKIQRLNSRALEARRLAASAALWSHCRAKITTTRRA